MSKTLISVVSPVYKAYNIVDELVIQLIKSLEKITPNYEIILVDDGCPDNSWIKISENCKLNNKIKGVKLSRNFGQHHAITAGLDQAIGEWVVVMDCDLQDRPEEIINLYEKTKHGFDIVLAQRIIRHDSFYKKMSSKLFYRTFAYLTNTPQDESIANFGIYHSKVIKAINSMRESSRAFPTMVKWVGFNKTSIPVQHAERFSGTTTYNWKKLINLAIDIIISYSDKPLKLAIKTGFLISFFSLLFAVFIFIAYLTDYITVSGYTSVIMSIWFLSGLIIFIIGLVGLYMGKTFDSVKNRPIYIIDKSLNTND
jgi:dolichol-phosphate mannosyltransferase